VTVSTRVYEGASLGSMSHGFTTQMVTIKAYNGYYTGVFGNFRRVGEDGDLSVSGSVNQNNVHYTTTNPDPHVPDLNTHRIPRQTRSE
jgi:hypothetical protein